MEAKREHSSNICMSIRLFKAQSSGVSKMLGHASILVSSAYCEYLSGCISSYGILPGDLLRDVFI